MELADPDSPCATLATQGPLWGCRPVPWINHQRQPAQQTNGTNLHSPPCSLCLYCLISKFCLQFFSTFISSTQETACGHFFPPPVLPGFQPTDLHLLQSHVGFSIRFLDGKDAQRIIFLWDNFLPFKKKKKSHWVQGEKRSSRFVRELNQVLL